MRRVCLFPRCTTYAHSRTTKLIIATVMVIKKLCVECNDSVARCPGQKCSVCYAIGLGKKAKKRKKPQSPQKIVSTTKSPPAKQTRASKQPPSSKTSLLISKSSFSSKYEYNRWVVKHQLYKVIQLQAIVRLFVIRRTPFFRRVLRQKCACAKVQSVVCRMLAQRLVARMVLQMQNNLVICVRARRQKDACVKVQSFLCRMLTQYVAERIAVQLEIDLAKRKYWRDFQTLGLTVAATKQECGREYRRLAKIYHPDMHRPERTGKIKEEAKVLFLTISEANTSLKHV